MRRVVASAHPNIALVKYWGKRAAFLNLPAVPSLSLTLSDFETRTSVRWGTDEDVVHLNGEDAGEEERQKVLDHLDRVAPKRPPCFVDSVNSFPTGAGLASSSSGFAALTVAIAAAAGKDLPMDRLSALARQGSGSACRSLWGGWVEWRHGEARDGSDSHGVPIAPADHWDVRMIVAVVSGRKKAIGSTEAMERSRRTSPYYDRWVETAAADVEIARKAVLDRDIEVLGDVMEASTFKMHALCHTSRPIIDYWLPDTLACIRKVRQLREEGTGAWVTMDAGPNVKVLTLPEHADAVVKAIAPYADAVHVLRAGGDPTVSVQEIG